MKWRPSGPALALLGLLTLFALLLGMSGELEKFASLGNLKVLLRGNSTLAVVALGMLLVILSGGIDLSAGSVVALVTVVTIQVYKLLHNGPEAVFPAEFVGWLTERGWAWSGGSATASAAAVAAGMLTAALCGAANGLVVTRLKLAPFVATLGMMSVARGLAYLLSGKTNVSFVGRPPGWVRALANTSSDQFYFSPAVWSVAALAVVLAVLLSRTVFGRYVYAIGANEAAAFRSGVATDRVKLWVYVLGGLLIGWAGVLGFAYGSGGDPGGGVGLELDAIAAVVVGGASLSGGRGTVGGTLIGVLILAILENGLVLLKAGVEVKTMLVGLILIVGLALTGWRERRGA